MGGIEGMGILPVVGIVGTVAGIDPASFVNPLSIGYSFTTASVFSGFPNRYLRIIFISFHLFKNIMSYAIIIAAAEGEILHISSFF